MTYQHRANKWVSLMLPEHKERLHALRESLDIEPVPELDEQQREAIGLSLAEAQRDGRPVMVRYFRAGRRHAVSGYVLELNPAVIVLVDSRGLSNRLNLVDLLDVEPITEAN